MHAVIEHRSVVIAGLGVLRRRGSGGRVLMDDRSDWI